MAITDARAVSLELPQITVGGENELELGVISGLGRKVKSLPSKYFYDATGSMLFERITELPEYYVTRSEVDVLSKSGPEIVRLLPRNCALVEFGAGSSRKLRILFGMASGIGAYVPVDISGDFLREDAGRLQRDLPALPVYPVVADFTAQFPLPDEIRALPRAGFFPGSTIGNLEPRDAGGLLRHFGSILGRGAKLIVGVDLVKDEGILASAYDDASQVTARFNLNLLWRINRELDGNFDLAKFQHRAFYNMSESRVEMHLVSKCRQEVRVAGQIFHFDADESIHTENSYKYTVESFQALASESGWVTMGVWTDGLFSVHAFEYRQ